MEEGEGQKEGEGFHTHKYTLHVNKADEIKNKNHTYIYQKSCSSSLSLLRNHLMPASADTAAGQTILQIPEKNQR